MTIRDVAQRAGVSKSTVSLVINNSPKVKMETKYRVLAAIEEMGYIPNISAVELTTKRKLNLGMVMVTNHDSPLRTSFTTMVDNYFHDVSSGIYDVIQNSNYGVLVEQFTATAAHCDHLPNLVKTNRVDGIFVIGGLFDDSFIRNLLERNIPTVVLGRDYLGLDCVTTDSKFATYLGVKYLIDNGHRDILYISGPDLTPSTQLKDSGYRLALTEASLSYRDAYYTKSEFTGLGGYLAAKDVFENRRLSPTAIFASNDSIAVGAMRYLYERNLRIPDQISIASYDDSILSEHAIPPLTCVGIHKEQIGSEAAHLLLKRIQNTGAKRRCITVPVELIVRDSVANIR